MIASTRHPLRRVSRAASRPVSRSSAPAELHSTLAGSQPLIAGAYLVDVYGRAKASSGRCPEAPPLAAAEPNVDRVSDRRRGRRGDDRHRHAAGSQGVHGRAEAESAAESGRRAGERERRRPADAAADRLRQAGEGRDRRGWPSALGHDAAGPARSEPAGHDDAVGAAGPQGDDPPGPRTVDDAEDQCGLLDRRREAGGQDCQAGARDQDQPRDRHQLPGLQDARRLSRMHLRPGRPALLPLEHRPRAEPDILGDQHPAGLSEAVRPGRARLRSLPAHRHRPRPQRPAAGLPAPDQEPDRRRRPDLAPVRSSSRSSASTRAPTSARATTCSNCSS